MCGISLASLGVGLDAFIMQSGAFTVNGQPQPTFYAYLEY
jgi:hypothetical protein